MSARLTLLPHPFDTRGRRVLELHAGRALRAELPGDARGWAVTLNGRPVPVELVAELELAEGDIATARPLVREAGTAGLIAAAIIKSAVESLAVGSVVAQVAGVVAGAAASYALSRMLAPDVSRSAGAPASQPFFSVQGVRNQTRPFGALPQHYGRLRVVPDLIASPITSVSADGVQTIRALFCLGVGRYAGIVATGDAIRIGAQAVSTLGVTDFAVYSGLEDADPPSERLERFASNVVEEQLGLQLRHEAVTGSQEHIRTTAEDALGFDVQLVFPSGIWRISDSGRQFGANVLAVVRYREVGDPDWILAEERIVAGFITERFPVLFHIDPPGAAQYEVSVKLHAMMSRGVYPTDRGGGGGSTAMTGDALWTSLRSYLLGDAIIDEHTDDVTMFGLAMDASELVNGTLDQVSVESTRVLPTWSEADGWSDVDLGDRAPAAYTETRSPAWAFANELRDSGVPDDELDAPQLFAWAEFCTLKGWLCDWQQNDELTLDESLRVIASAGQAFPAERNGLRSVVFEVAREPVAAFGPHNARDLVSTQNVIERVDAIRVRFVNGAPTADGRLDEQTVYFNGHSRTTAQVYRTADVLNGLTSWLLVERYIRLERLKAERRSISHEWRTDWSAAVVEVGDVVLLQGAGALRGAAQSECTGYSTRDAGVNIDEVFVYPAVRVEAGVEYHVRVRTRARGEDGGYRILALPIANPLTAGVQKLTALPIDGDFPVPVYEDDAEIEQTDDLEGQPAFLGEPDDGLVLVTDVRFEEAGTCSLSGVDFAPDIFDAVLLETPHESGVSPHEIANLAPDAPVLAGEVLAQLLGYSGTGFGYHADYQFTVPLAPPAAFPPVVRYRVQYRWHTYIPPSPDAGQRSLWFDLPDQQAPAAQLVIGPLAAYRGFDIRVWAVSVAGAPSAPLLIPSAELL